MQIGTNFKVGAFYGLTAPLLVLSKPGEVMSALKAIHGTSSVESLVDLDIELYALKLIIEQNELATPQIEYSNISDPSVMLTILQGDDYKEELERWGNPQTPADAMKKYAQITRTINKIINKAQKGEVDSKSLSDLKLGSVDEAVNYKQFLDLLNNSSKGISNKVKTAEGEVSLSPDALTLLRAIISNAEFLIAKFGISKLQWIMDKVEEAKQTRLTPTRKFFGMELSTLTRFEKPTSFNTINSPYETSMSSTSVSDALMIRNTQEYLRECETLMNQDEAGSDNVTNKFPDQQGLDALTDSDIRVMLMDTLGVDSKVEFIMDIVKRYGATTNVLNTQTVLALDNFKTLHDTLIFNINNNYLPHIKDKLQLQKVFDELAYAGIIGLSIYGVEMLVREINIRPLAKPTTNITKVSPESPLYINCSIMRRDAESKLHYYEHKERGGVVLE